MKTNFWKKLNKVIMAQTLSNPGVKQTFVQRKNLIMKRLNSDPKYRARFMRGLEEPGIVRKPKNLTPFYVPPKVN